MDDDSDCTDFDAGRKSHTYKLTHYNGSNAYINISANYWVFLYPETRAILSNYTGEPVEVNMFWRNSFQVFYKGHWSFIIKSSNVHYDLDKMVEV
jgi:hypothetical protein